MQALDDIVVLDLSQHIAGPYATKLMADYGADVIKVEKPGGDIARSFGPFAGGEPHPEKSGLFFFLNTNKRSVVLDVKSDDGREALRRLAARAHVVVSSYSPAVAGRLGLTWDFFREIRRDLSMVSVTNFGQSGPYRDYRLTELPLYGFAGEMHSMGLTEREPTKMAGTAALFESGAAIAPAILAAVFAAATNGEGQHVDISLAETHFGGVDRRHATAIGFQFSGRRTVRAAGGAAGMPSGIYPCLDGWVEFANAGVHPDRVREMLNHAEWLDDPMYQDPMARVNPAIIEAWNANFIVWCLERTKREIWAEARRAKVMCGPLFTTQDLYEDEHFRGRGFWARAEHPVMGSVEFHGRPFIMQEGGWQLRRPAPLLGEHTEEVLREAGLDEALVGRLAAAAGGGK